jgi:hypothetical protein
MGALVDKYCPGIAATSLVAVVVLVVLFIILGAVRRGP